MHHRGTAITTHLSQHIHQPRIRHRDEQRLTKLTCKHIEIDLKERAGDQKFQILRQAKKADRAHGAVRELKCREPEDTDGGNPHPPVGVLSGRQQPHAAVCADVRVIYFAMYAVVVILGPEQAHATHPNCRCQIRRVRSTRTATPVERSTARTSEASAAHG